ncbi:MAG TPA: hypothetical protein P5234_01955 [Thermoanaerobaculaceae bacterium]|nr:hypothetical protein [Thermoanaerobaculaceae bacterium]HRS14992.1 hypothetical protein [Thermoanaerobaculaceae bacterium]
MSSPFVRLVLAEALSAAGLAVVEIDAGCALPVALRVLVADLDALGPRAAGEVSRRLQAGTAVLVLGRKGQDAALRALAALGAFTGERGQFLSAFPDLLAAALRQARPDPPPSDPCARA